MTAAAQAPAPVRGSGPAPHTKTALSHRMAERGVDRSLFLLLPGLVFLVLLFVYPFLNGLSLSFLPVNKHYWGVLISLIISGFPFAFLLILSYLSGIDPSLDAAAATLGASPSKRFWQITFPLLAPGLAITFCLTFVLAFSVFPSAYLVGDPTNTTHVISITAYDAAYSDFDYSMAPA